MSIIIIIIITNINITSTNDIANHISKDNNTNNIIL